LCALEPAVFAPAILAKCGTMARSHIQASVSVVRAFVKLRELLATHKDLARKLEELERKYDRQFGVVFDAIKQLMAPPPEPPRGKLGFQPHLGGLTEQVRNSTIA
jgi:hypothetical protein